MSQTYALLMDAYHELNAKKLFWISLVLSLLIAASFFLVGINEHGVKLIAWQMDNDFFNTQTTTPGAFYKLIFSSLGIRYWLGLAATALAIISTASFFPDMMQSGSIDLLLCKPIGRLRLFITRFALGLLFAFLQVLAFTTASFLVIGIRGGVWEPGIFIAVPLFVLFFSYIFAVSVLVGVMTRSTVAALLVTLLLWGLLLIVNATDVIVTSQQFQSETYAEQMQERAEFANKLEGERLEEFEQSYMPREVLNQQAEDAQRQANNAAEIAGVVRMIKAPMPKTGETLDLLQRLTINAADLPDPEVFAPGDADQFEGQVRSSAEIAREKAKELEQPAWWVIGTSLVFEFSLLGVAAWVFCRRDY